MLWLTTADGFGPGAEISLPAAGGRLQFRLSACSDQDLTSAEIVVNGVVVRNFEINDPRQLEREFGLELKRGSWIAARCAARDDWLSDAELARYANGDQQQPSRLRFAHTSPIYVTVDGRGAAEPQSIREGLAMLERLEIYGRENAAPDHWPGFQEAIRQAREILQRRR
jgi:hypothetical protein